MVSWANKRCSQRKILFTSLQWLLPCRKGLIAGVPWLAFSVERLTAIGWWYCILRVFTSHQALQRYVLFHSTWRHATVKLWRKFTRSFDASTLRDWSKREPILILFVGVMVHQYAGTMAFKNTYSTSWYVNVDIPEMKATLERYFQWYLVLSLSHYAFSVYECTT